MKYKVLSSKAFEDFVRTEVEYTLEDGTKVVTLIPHFRPASAAEVEQGIINRAPEETNKAAATKGCVQIAAQVEVGVDKAI